MQDRQWTPMDKMALPIGALVPSTATRASNGSDTSLYSNTPPYEVPGRATRRHSNVFDWSQLLAESQVRGHDSYRRNAGSWPTASTLAKVTLGLRSIMGLLLVTPAAHRGCYKLAGAAHLLAMHVGKGRGCCCRWRKDPALPGGWLHGGPPSSSSRQPTQRCACLTAAQTCAWAPHRPSAPVPACQAPSPLRKSRPLPRPCGESHTRLLSAERANRPENPANL